MYTHSLRRLPYPTKLQSFLPNSPPSRTNNIYHRSNPRLHRIHQSDTKVNIFINPTLHRISLLRFYITSYLQSILTLDIHRWIENAQQKWWQLLYYVARWNQASFRTQSRIRQYINSYHSKIYASFASLNFLEYYCD